MKKDEILQLVAQEMEKNITEMRNSLNDYEEASNIDEGDTVDPENFSQQSENKEMQYVMQGKLDGALATLEQLQEFSGKSFSVARSGALIETDKNYFLLGISFPAVKVGNKELLGISNESPAFNVINGMSSNDTFKLGNNTFTIKAIT
ncbi:MAG TPA: hypothetical protein VFG10_14390 [Saprospiraceae bacterium]|nr:hypothetical protein [Saprospiraceae bacterium]